MTLLLSRNYGGDADDILALNTKERQDVISRASEEEQRHDLISADSQEEQSQDVISAKNSATMSSDINTVYMKQFFYIYMKKLDKKVS